MRVDLCFLLSLSCSLAAFGANVQQTITLPKGTSVTAINVDSAGNIYIAGWVTPDSPKSSNDYSDAFVAKLSAAGNQTIYWKEFGGSSSDSVNRMALAPDGTAIVGGTTLSADFPDTPGSAQPQYATNATTEGFVASIAPDGAVRYATYVGTDVAGGNVYAIATDASGAAYITGQGNGFSGTTSNNPPDWFVAKLDASGKVIFSNPTVGGTTIAVNASGIYVAGIAQGGVQVTPGVFQALIPTGPIESCGGTTELGMPCFSQYVAKLDAGGSRIVYQTYLTGSSTSSPAAVAADAQGNLYVAGYTNSIDLRWTPRLRQSVNPLFAVR